MIAQAYLARVRELLPDNIPATFLPLQPVGFQPNISISGTLTLPSEVALQSGWHSVESVAARASKSW